jgi:hypothetical protein
MSAPKATRAAIQRVIEATQAAGLMPSAVVVNKDGSVRIETTFEKSMDTIEPSAQVLKPKEWAQR